MRTVSAAATGRWSIRSQAVVRAMGIGVASLCLIGVSAGLLSASEWAGERLSGTQGQILVVKIRETDRTAEVSGTFLGRTIPFFPDPRHEEPAGYVGLLGLDLQQKPGIHTLPVEVNSQGHTRRVLFACRCARGHSPCSILPFHGRRWIWTR